MEQPEEAIVRDPEQVVAAERGDILVRRAWLRSQYGERFGRPHEPAAGSGLNDLVGLALSGGGVRSAGFCLGALQALDALPAISNGRNPTTRPADALGEPTAFEHVDYLSTVSGGGFVGASVTAGMSHFDGLFPFRSSLETDETLALQHVRDHSNYLFPKREWAFVRNLAVVLRGLMANIALVTPILLIFAFVTVSLYRPRLHPWPTAWLDALRSLGMPLPRFDRWLFPLVPRYHLPSWMLLPGPLPVATLVVVALLVFLLGAAFVRSFGRVRAETTIVKGRDLVPLWVKAPIWILAITFAVEVEPLLLDLLSRTVGSARDGGAQNAIAYLAGIAGGGSGLIALLRGKIVGLVARLAAASGRSAAVGRVAMRGLLILGGMSGPIMLWLVFALICFRFYEVGFIPRWGHWLAVFGLLLVVSLLDANANSLHRLYRDRLSWTFLMQPRKRTADPKENDKPLEQLSDLQLPKLDPRLVPYHLLNATLNLQGSRHANRRGRDADFFMFSRRFAGSRATGYARSTPTDPDPKEKLELTPATGLRGSARAVKRLFARMRSGVARKFQGAAGPVEWEQPDLGTIVAICGAAVSSNMGSTGLKALAPTLAIANVRLGYWLANPAKIGVDVPWYERLFRGRRLYFLNEILGLLDETSLDIYLTDGGHIENLGVFELLRRRCRLIIAVDAECDPALGFHSLIKLERYARIDLGVRIELPWAQIGKPAKSIYAGLPPHCAVGKIFYPGGTTGILLYVKASTNGDENDYVADYKRRYPSFPHETTLDQLFGEEQFEAYRALGFHILQRALSGEDEVAIGDIHSRLDPRVNHDPMVREIRAMLGIER